MSLKLMYITNQPEVAKIAEEAGVDRIFLDMEYIGKADRQGGMDTVQLNHTIQDIKNIRAVIEKSEVLVRVNPIHDEGEYRGIQHTSSEQEIAEVIDAGADIVMLPYFRTKEELERFVKIVDGRLKTMLLVETKAAADMIEDIAVMDGIDMIHIGINDLCIDQGKTFMFQLLADGTVEHLCSILNKYNKPYGFGGIAAPGGGLLPAEYIIHDHYQYGSSCVILSRSFYDTSKITDLEIIRKTFESGVKAIRQVEEEAAGFTKDQFEANHQEVIKGVDKIVDLILSRKK